MLPMQLIGRFGELLMQSNFSNDVPRVAHGRAHPAPCVRPRVSQKELTSQTDYYLVILS